jgi:sodium transport system permease protein
LIVGLLLTVLARDAGSSGERRALVALSVFPVFLLVSTFVTGMGLAIDVTAGERERRSLEPLLLTRADPLAICVGKWGAAGVLNFGGFILTLVLAMAILARQPLEAAGVRPGSPGGLLAGAIAVGFPLALLAAALQVAAAAQARSFKEGQTYLSMLMFVPMTTGMLLAFSPATASAWHLAVPVLGQHDLLSAVVRGEAPGAPGFLLPAAVAVAVAAALLRRTSTLLPSARILYGR